MSKRDYYDVLGVSKGANDDEIKKAYKKLAKKYLKSCGLLTKQVINMAIKENLTIRL